MKTYLCFERGYLPTDLEYYTIEAKNDDDAREDAGKWGATVVCQLTEEDLNRGYLKMGTMKVML